MKKSLFWSMTMLMTIVLLLFTACGDDEEEPSLDELLSDKTTPVTFELEKGVHFMYDYAGSHYVGGDTIDVWKKKEVKRDLRQGRHSILWLRDPWNDKAELYETYFDAKHKMLVRNGEFPTLGSPVFYAESEINVGEYLLPTQTLTYSSLISGVDLYVEDADCYPGVFDDDKTQIIGSLKGYPNIVSVSLTGNDYERRESVDLPIYYYPRTSNMQIMGSSRCFLCPKEGLDDIQLVIEIRGADGKVITTSELPKLSFRRGEGVRLRGTLFSGSTSDWSVIEYN